jgi:hypothetical protein
MKKYFNLICLTLIMAMFQLVLLGCSKSTPTHAPELVDKNPFTGIPCEAPCWHDLTVGESNESDVMSKLPTLTFIDQNAIDTHKLSLPSLDPFVYAQGTEITADCKYSAKHCVRLRIVDNVLTEIVVTIDYEITLQEAIEYLGDPHYIGYQDLGAEEIICEINLVWFDKQLILASEQFRGNDALSNCKMVQDTHKTTPQLKVFEARYVSVLAMNSVLTNATGQFYEFKGTVPEK